MEGLAEPGTTYVTEETFKLTEGLFRYESLGERKVKGKQETVKVYRVIGQSNRRTRFDVSAERGLTSFVGRERELEILMDSFERAKQGRGQAISIMGEAGLGKSRLLYEFRKAVANEDVTFLEGKCLSYSRGVAYHPVIDILKANFDIREGDGDIDIKEKVKRGLRVLQVDEDSTLPYFLELLSVKDSGIDKINLSPESKKEQIIEALNRNVIKGSEIRPVIMAVEDLHWVDKSSEERFKYLLNSISGARIFLIFTYRPEFVHTWGRKSYHSQINLNRLSNRESLEMIMYLLGAAETEKDLEELILEKTEGVPFFIEEFIKSLKDLKIVERHAHRYYLAKDVQNISIPATIQDMIMARIDSLPAQAKELLQMGSAIEREFGYELIKMVSGLPEKELLPHLSVLKDSELLYERGIYPQSTYVFKHALTREVVYDSILSKRKQVLHDKIGIAIEVLFHGKIEEHYESLVDHFIIAKDYNKAAEYAKLATRKTRRSFSYHETFAFQKKLIYCYEQLPQTDKIMEKVIQSRVLLGHYYVALNYHAESKEAVDPVLKLAKQAGFEKYLSQILTMIGWYYMLVENDIEKSIGYLEEALQKAEEADDDFSIFFTYVTMGWIFWLGGEFERSIDSWNKSAGSERSNQIIEVARRKSALSHIYFYLGELNFSSKMSDEADKLREEGDVAGSAVNSLVYSSQGLSNFGKGNFKAAEHYHRKARDDNFKMQRYSWYIYANLQLAETYFELHDYQESAICYKTVVQTSEQNRIVPFWRDIAIIGIARASVMDKKTDVDLELLREVLMKDDVNFTKGWKARYMGEILLTIGDQYMSEAEDWIKKALSANTEIGVRFFLAQDHALYSKYFKHQNDLHQAREQMSKAAHIMRECGADGWVKRYEEELAQLYKSDYFKTNRTRNWAAGSVTTVK
jgi:tetratricopeptide (TPR) repeat protein